MTNYDALALAEAKRQELANKIRDISDNPKVIRQINEPITQLMAPPERYIKHDRVCIYRDPHKLFI